MDIEEPTCEITSSMPFACDECKKHEAMIADLKKENQALREMQNLKLKKIYNISLKEQLFKRLIGLSKTSFDTLWNFVRPGEYCEKLMFYDPSRRGDDTVSPGRSEENKRGRKPKMLPADQLFMFFVRLKSDLTLDTMSRMLISCINYLYFSIRAIPLWPT